MKKIVGIAAVLVLCGSIFYLRQVKQEQALLQQSVVRLHVVGASNSEHDQRVKLSVRDAVLQIIEPMLAGVSDCQQAKQIIAQSLPQIREAANMALSSLGETKQAVVRFMQEEFPLREYDSFTLPSGIYESLRIVIGEGEGRNWWCVVFPKMCYSAASIRDVSAGAGFSDGLTGAITGQYQLRFFFLDALGQLQNFFH